MSTDRFVPFEGCWNFRDLGGYKTADGQLVSWNRLYRSDSLHWMTSEDAHKATNDMNIVQVLDLRSTDETERFGKGPITECQINYRHLPVAESIDYKKLLGTSPIYTALRIPYIHILKHGKEEIADALTALSKPDAYPVVFFCTAGMDRTGILATVVLSLLGVSDNGIVSDYVLSNEHMQRMMDRWRAMPFYSWLFETYPEDIFFVQKEMIEVLLEEVRREFGSILDYVLSCGVSEEALVNLKKNFLTSMTKKVD